MKKFASLFLLMPLLAVAVRADDLVDLALWDTAGAQPEAASYPVTSKAVGLSVADLVRGSGLNSYSSPQNAFVANGYSAASYDAAVTAGDYWETKLMPADDYSLSLAELAYTFRATKTGPNYWQWTYSFDGISFTKIGDEVAWVSTDYTEVSIDLSTVKAFENVTTPVWFRLYAWDGGTRQDATGVFGKDKIALIFRGVAASATEPPTISISGFSSVAVSNTLSLSVFAIPSGSVITSCAFTARPAGVTNWNASSGTFSFTPAAADFDRTFTLRAVATNAYGTTTNTHAVAVTRYVPLGSYFIDFEDGKGKKTIYAAADVELHGVTWTLDNVLIGNLAADRKNGDYAARFTNDLAGAMTSKTPVTDTGVGEISFSYATYGDDQTGAVLHVEVSTTNTASWIPVADYTITNVHSLVSVTNAVATAQPLYLRFSIDKGDHDRINIDDILVTPYSPPAAGSYEAFLLKYNVTPGDSLTGPADDYDGDGFSNDAEYNADTNPYDPDSHP